MVFSDYMKRGGIHGSKNAYIRLDLRTQAIQMVPTPAISDLETLKGTEPRVWGLSEEELSQ